jgi:hypothetical protein
MKTRMATSIAVGAVSASLLLAACGGSGKSSANNVTSGQAPRQAVETAVSELGAQSSIEMTVSLPISADQAKQLSTKGGGRPMSTAEAKALTTGTIFFAESTGHGEAIDSTQARTDGQNTYDFGLTVGHDTPLEVRYVGQNLFVHAQVQQLLSDVGQNPGQAKKFEAVLGQVNTFVPGIGALGQGKWVEITHAGLRSLSASLKHQIPGASAAGSSQFQSAVLKLRTEVLAALQTDSVFASTGRSNGRDGYKVTVNVASLINTLSPDFANTFATLPGVGSQLSGRLSGMAKRIPAGQTAVIGVYVSGNRVSEADLDLNQFAGKDKVSFPVPLRLAFTSPGAASAPLGATTLDVSKVPALLGNLFNPGGTSSSGSVSTAAG